MVPRVAVIVSFLLLLPAAAIPSSGPHIADLDILLPPRLTNPVHYRLQGSDGCFFWSWDHHDLLSVEPEYNDTSQCSTSARLISIAPYSGKRETAIYATDIRSGATVHCKVFIDKISRIKIFHHAVKINLDELATLQIRAFDEEENVFSSLVGLQFSWQLIPKSLDADSIHRLDHVPLKETPLRDCVSGFCGDLDIQLELEDEGLGSDLYVVKGIGIGHEIVIAKLLEPQLEYVEDEIILTVAEAMSLDPPSPVFVTVGTLVYYSLRVIRENAPKVIELPSPHHHWSVLNPSVARVDSMMGTVYALHLGMTNIVVNDTRLSGHIQTSALHVVFPKNLLLYLVPVTPTFDPVEGVDPIPSSEAWFVFPGQLYIIGMKVFSEGPDSREILILEKANLKLEDDTSEFWDILPVPNAISTKHSCRNSRLLKPYFVGEGALTASLFYHSENKDEVQALRAVQGVTVCREVKFSIREQVDFSGIISIPWAPAIYQELELKATGGCDNLFWLSTNEAIASVTASGFVTARRPGTTTIKVISLLDSINYDEVVLEVTRPSSIAFLPVYPVEVAVGTELKAAVTLKTTHGNYFYQCDAFNSFIRWNIFSESEIFSPRNITEKICEPNMLHLTVNSKQSFGKPCAWTCLFAYGHGRAMLHATLSMELSSPLQSKENPLILRADYLIAAYSPLVAYQAGNGNKFGGYWVDIPEMNNGIKHSQFPPLNELYLAPGSAIDVLLSGGPDQWDHHVEYVESADINSEEVLSVTDGAQVLKTFSTGTRLYTVLCLSVGNFKILFSRGNLIGWDHPVPTIANLELSVVCSIPSSITLVANEPANTLDVIEAAANADRGSGHVRSSPIIVATGRTVRIAAVGVHISKKAFANSSSLCLSWEFFGCKDLAYLSGNESCKMSTDNNWERFIVLNKTSGSCTVRASIIGLSEIIVSYLLGKEYLQLESMKGVLTDALQLQFVSSLRIKPESVVVVFDPRAEVNLSVSGGTGFLNTVSNDTLVADIRQASENVKSSHLKVIPRGLGTALIAVRDIGISPPVVSFSSVKVANVEWIKLASEEEICLMEGATRSFELIAGTNDGYVFEATQYTFMNIHIHVEDGILELIGKHNSSSVMVGHMFSVRAVIVGITVIFVSVRQQSGHERLSQTVKVEVYKPLQVHPDYIYLAPGASYVLTSKGGPVTAGVIKYTSLHAESAVVQASSGKVSAISIGNSTIHSASYGKTGNLICEAYSTVEVGIPSKMFLSSQSDHLCIGCKMPIFPSFPQGSLFSFYDICNDYEWRVDIEKAVQPENGRTLTSDVEKLQIQCADGWASFCYPSNSDVGFIKTLFGRSSGRAQVSLSFSCDFLLLGTTKSVHYTTFKTLTVVPDPPLALGKQITWVLPPSYTTSELLPSLTNSYGLDVHSHMKGIIYSVLSTCESKQGSITIHGHKIRTRDNNDVACILGKDQTSQRSEIASCVRVAQVAQVRISASEYSFHSAHVGVNEKLELIINYCDELGFTFSEANDVVPLNLEINYPDVLSIQMLDDKNITSAGNFFLKTRGPGSALVKISFSHNPDKADFILVSVGAQLYPQNPVMKVGHSIIFSVTGDGGLLPGQWYCSNGSVLSLNRNTGQAHASAEGGTQVFFQGSSFKLQTMVSVIKANQIIVNAPSDTMTNAPFPSKGYKFVVKFSDISDYKYKFSEEYYEVLYECRVDPPILGFSKPWADDEAGDFSCLFFPYTPKNLQLVFSTSTEFQSKMINYSESFVHFSIIASLKEAPHIMGCARAVLFGGFSIGIDRLNLTPSSNRSRINVTGNTDLEIYWDMKDLLLVNLISKEGFGIGGFAEYEVKVIKSQSFKEKLIFVLPATGQKAEIDVIFGNGMSANPAPAGIMKWSAIIVCLILLISTIFIFVKLIEKPARPVASSPATTTSSACPSSIRLSPRTPQPLAEYVRQTIDETPYYKRRGGTIFDPQNTY